MPAYEAVKHNLIDSTLREFPFDQLYVHAGRSRITSGMAVLGLVQLRHHLKR